MIVKRYFVTIVGNWITDRNSVMQEFTKLHTVSENKDQGNLINAENARTSEIRSSDVAQIKSAENDNTVFSQSCTVNEKLLKGIIEDSCFCIVFLCSEKQRQLILRDAITSCIKSGMIIIL